MPTRSWASRPGVSFGVHCTDNVQGADPDAERLWLEKNSVIDNEKPAMDNSNADLIQRTYQAFGAGDLDTVLGILDPEVAWHVPGHSQLSGAYKGHDQVVGVLRQDDGTVGEHVHDRYRRRARRRRARGRAVHSRGRAGRASLDLAGGARVASGRRSRDQLP